MLRKTTYTDLSSRNPGFEYIDSKTFYFDTACQSMRPQPVIDTLVEYYHSYNACGGRVKYAWGQKVDEAVAGVRSTLIKVLGYKEKTHAVSFTQNTTYGMNLLLTQIKGDWRRVITSDIEHNSAFLPTIELARRLGVERLVLPRSRDGSFEVSDEQLRGSIVVLNSVSNIDGRSLRNIHELAKRIRKAGGLFIVDAAQTMAHHREMLRGVEADAICFSSHKMYGPSLGVIVYNKTLLDHLDIRFIGGGMVQTVHDDVYELTDNDYESRFEPGLQAFGEIIALGEALKWYDSLKPATGKSPTVQLDRLSTKLYDALRIIPGIELFNNTPSSVISLTSSAHDAHRLATFLSAVGIMVRSGYFCCHHYLQHSLASPPLVRFSLGLHTNDDDIEKVVSTLQKLHGVK